MFDDLRRKIAHYNIRHKYLKNSTTPIQFNKIVSNSNTIFIILPNNKQELDYSLDIIDYLVMNDKQVTLFVLFENRDAIAKYVNATILTFNSISVTKFFLPNKSLIQKLKTLKFDVVLDLERNENTFISAIANIVQSNVRIGFKKNRSESYYNLLVQNLDQNIGSNYDNMFNTIKML